MEQSLTIQSRGRRARKIVAPRVMVKTPCSWKKEIGKVPSTLREELEYTLGPELQLEDRQEDFKGYVPRTQGNSTYLRLRFNQDIRAHHPYCTAFTMLKTIE